MTNAELFHRWANQVKPRGGSGNVFYEGPILYSYGKHYVAAVLTGKHHPDGREIVLVNSTRYSVTTARHVSQAVRASTHKYHIRVPYPTGEYRTNLEHLNTETKAAYEKVKIVRTSTDYHERFVRHCEEAATVYRDVYQVKSVDVWRIPENFSGILAAAREREAKHEEQRKELRERTARLNALSHAEKMERWRAGENVSLSWGLPVMLRLKSDDICETSLGAEIPLDHAKRLYKLVCAVMAKGEDWTADLAHATPAGVYTVNDITKDGTLTAGCHSIKFDEIDRFAAERGWKV